MTLVELFVYVIGSLGVVVILCGVAIIAFGSNGNIIGGKIVLSLKPLQVQLPYSAGFVICLVGLSLIYIVFNVVMKGGVPEQYRTGLWISSVHAQTSTRKPVAPPGWVYFGPEGSPKLWNFTFVRGDYSDLHEQKPGVVLKALRDVNIRGHHFGSFTGTVLGFLSPEPPVLGTIPKGKCAVPEEFVSVGFSKIWVKVTPEACPQ
jgi:hypothetical protein